MSVELYLRKRAFQHTYLVTFILQCITTPARVTIHLTAMYIHTIAGFIYFIGNVFILKAKVLTCSYITLFQLPQVHFNYYITLPQIIAENCMYLSVECM